MAVGYLTGFDFLTNITADYLESYYFASSFRGTFAFVFVGRYRPNQNMGPRYFKFNDGESFPSGHSANIACASRVFAHHIRWLPAQIAIYSIAGIVNIQRLTERAHWPADVYFGYTYAWFLADALFDLHDNRKLKIIPTSTSNGDGLGFVVRFTF